MAWRDKLRAYEKIPGLLQQLSHAVEQMCAPFWWSLQEDPVKPATILHNGSVCYLNTGGAELGITADHVLAQYLADLARFGTQAVECQFGGSTIKAEERMLARNDTLYVVNRTGFGGGPIQREDGAHGTTKQVLARVAGAGGADGLRARARISLAVGSDSIGRREDRLSR